MARKEKPGRRGEYDRSSHGEKREQNQHRRDGMDITRTLREASLFRVCSSLYWAREDSSPEPIVDSELAVIGTSWLRSDSPTYSRATAAPRSRWSGAAKE